MKKTCVTAMSGLLVMMTCAVSAHPGQMTLAPVLEKVTPAVVNIAVTATQGTQRNPLLNDPFFRRYFNIPDQPREAPQSQSVGSGVIIDAARSLVVTNHHVIDAASEIEVTLRDGQRFKATLVGSDKATDIALLRLERGARLTDIPLGNSKSLRVGDFVVAIGNPFGLGQTATSGIVSALGRGGVIPEGYEDFIQTDASINPGNSGGALVDVEGRLVGINTAIVTPAGGNVGIGFAVPVNMMRAIVDQLLEYGEVKRGALGVTIQDVTPDLAEALDLSSAKGALVAQVMPGSAAAQAGVEVGDVILAIDGEAVDGSADVRNRIGLMRVGREVVIDLVREGKRREVRTEIGEITAARLAGASSHPLLEGAEFHAADPERTGGVQGVAAANVERGSPAWRAGLRPGDVILAVNREVVPDLARFEQALERVRGVLALHVQRGNARLYLVIR